ncbi:MAG: YqgE/AlgH family protein [Thermoguttaceae bacterium]
MQTYEGHLLIASPQLADENFAQSLVLLIEHNQEGAFGMIVNRPVKKTLQELWREVGSAPCHSQQPIYLGGPVPGPLMSLHTNPNLAETEPAPGVYFAAKKQHLDQLVLNENPAYKVFIGHAGWGAGQLENELRQGAWRVTAATADLIFSTAENLWKTVLQQVGQSVLRSTIRLKELPPDPSVN